MVIDRCDMRDGETDGPSLMSWKRAASSRITRSTGSGASDRAKARAVRRTRSTSDEARPESVDVAVGEWGGGGGKKQEETVPWYQSWLGSYDFMWSLTSSSAAAMISAFCLSGYRHVEEERGLGG